MRGEMDFSAFALALLLFFLGSLVGAFLLGYWLAPKDEHPVRTMYCYPGPAGCRWAADDGGLPSQW